MITVYIKTNTDGCIVSIDSSIFVADTTGWTAIDEGEGDRYAHAQNGYLDKPVMDEYGRYNYRYVDDKVEEIPEEDKPPIPEPVPAPPTNEELAAAIAEIADIITGGV